MRRRRGEIFEWRREPFGRENQGRDPRMGGRGSKRT